MLTIYSPLTNHWLTINQPLINAWWWVWMIRNDGQWGVGDKAGGWWWRLPLWYTKGIRRWNPQMIASTITLGMIMTATTTTTTMTTMILYCWRFKSSTEWEWWWWTKRDADSDDDVDNNDDVFSLGVAAVDVSGSYEKLNSHQGTFENKDSQTQTNLISHQKWCIIISRFPVLLHNSPLSFLVIICPLNHENDQRMIKKIVQVGEYDIPCQIRLACFLQRILLGVRAYGKHICCWLLLLVEHHPLTVINHHQWILIYQQ